MRDMRGLVVDVAGQGEAPAAVGGLRPATEQRSSSWYQSGFKLRCHGRDTTAGAPVNGHLHYEFLWPSVFDALRELPQPYATIVFRVSL